MQEILDVPCPWVACSLSYKPRNAHLKKWMKIVRPIFICLTLSPLGELIHTWTLMYSKQTLGFPRILSHSLSLFSISSFKAQPVFSSMEPTYPSSPNWFLSPPEHFNLCSPYRGDLCHPRLSKQQLLPFNFSSWDHEIILGLSLPLWSDITLSISHCFYHHHSLGLLQWPCDQPLFFLSVVPLLFFHKAAKVTFSK